MKTTPGQLSRIVHSFRPGAIVGPLVPLKGGISSSVAAFDVISGGETERMVLREPGQWALNRVDRATEVEFKLLSELTRQGFPASTPYYVAPPDAPVPLLIVAFLSGAPHFCPKDPGDYAQQMAMALARIHALPVDRFKFMPRMDGEIAHQIDWDPDRTKPVADEPRVRAILSEAWPFGSQNPPALLHGDFWPGNILWADEKITAPIDWEDGGIGDPLLDIAVSRQELAFAFDWELAESFTRAYAALTDLDWTHMPLWDLYASLRPIDQFSVWASGWADLGRPEVTADTMRAARADLVAYALDRLGA